jgi:hypothetical protein
LRECLAEKDGLIADLREDTDRWRSRRRDCYQRQTGHPPRLVVAVGRKVIRGLDLGVPGKSIDMPS